MPSKGDRLSQFAIVLWFGAIVAAFGFLAAYEQTPGAAAQSTSALSSDLDLPSKQGLSVLLMFLHPKCACSQASVGELEKILSHTPGSTDVCLYFYRPKDKPDSWTQTGLYDTAKRNGWTTRIDEDGAVARKLGAETSGHVMIYDTNGTLRFSGGVTTSRGHAGDNESADIASRALLNALESASFRPVFGCGIQGGTPVAASGLF